MALIIAVPTLQAIGVDAAIKDLIIAPARDQRVIPGFAIEVLTIAVAIAITPAAADQAVWTCPGFVPLL